MEKERILSSYTFPSEPSSDGYYHIYLTTTNGRKQIKAKNLDKLRERVYQFEQPDPNTFRVVFGMLMDQKTKYVKGKDRKASVANTVRILKSAFKRYFEGTEFADLEVEEISKKDIEDICYVNLERYELKNKAFLEMRGIIKQTLNLAFEEYMIPENPYLRVNFKKFNDMVVESTSISERVHSDEEIERMFKYIHSCQKDNPSYIAPYALELQILMGLRRGEIAPLLWTDVTDTFINITKEQLFVCKSDTNPKGYSMIVPHTKTHVNRQFPITERIREFLGRLKEVHYDHYRNSPYLFPAKTTSSGTITNFTVYKFYQKMCRDLGIEISRELKRGPHSFRRNGITHVCNATGGNIMMASVLYGNSPKSASAHYYTGVNLEQAKAILEEGNHNTRKGNHNS